MTQTISTIDITFSDGRLFCRGFLTQEGSELQGMEDDTVIEHAHTVTIQVVEDGVVTTEEHGDVDLEPGMYHINYHGLFKRIDGSPTD